jgi:L-alanine-DL-glutamate epimerase-like enolase superfamily enzyme
MRTVKVLSESWKLASAFVISRGTKTAADVVVCEIAAVSPDGRIVAGRGECVPYARYGETVASVIAGIEAHADALRDGIDHGGLQDRMKPGAARNAADCALWDLEAKLAGRPAWMLAGLPKPAACVTAYTISLGDSEIMYQAARDAAARPLLKLKLGADDPVACVEAVRRGSPQARLIADANEGWSVAQLKEIAPALARLGVELIEQPVPAAEDHGLEGYDCPLLLCADESFHVADDISDLAGRYGAVNVKLDKTGGFTEAVRAARTAEAAGLKIMTGCMVATSLAMAPAFALSPMAAYVDLDGPLLLKEDRAGGFRFDGSVMHPAGPDLWG